MGKFGNEFASRRIKVQKLERSEIDMNDN